jgi:hypothetical protein
MSLEELAFASQIIAAIAIIVSLIYAALQFRVYQASAREARLVTISADIQNFRILLMSDPDSARIFRDGLRDMKTLEPLDRWRFSAMLEHAVMNHSLAIEIDSSPGTDAAHSFDLLLRNPGVQQWWQRAKSRYSPRVQAAVDSKIKGSTQLAARNAPE